MWKTEREEYLSSGTPHTLYPMPHVAEWRSVETSEPVGFYAVDVLGPKCSLGRSAERGQRVETSYIGLAWQSVPELCTSFRKSGRVRILSYVKSLARRIHMQKPFAVGRLYPSLLVAVWRSVKTGEPRVITCVDGPGLRCSQGQSVKRGQRIGSACMGLACRGVPTFARWSRIWHGENP